MKVKPYVDANGEYRWTLIARNGRKIGDSGEGYKEKRKLIQTLQLIQKQCGEASNLWVALANAIRDAKEL